MPNYSYYILDANGKSQGGPYNVQQLQTLADQGTIVPDTPLGRSDGRQGHARQIGLVFPELPPHDPDYSEEDSQDITIEMVLWIVFGISLFLAFLGTLVWIVLALIALPITIISLIFALKEHIKNKLIVRANQGDAQSQLILGRQCLQRNDLTQAVSWFQKAADQGLADAQYTLGVCYEKGCGTVKDTVKAREWYKKAADQGHEKAKYEFERPEREKREREKQEAERKWRAEENRRRLNEMIEESPALRNLKEQMKGLFR